MPRGNRIPGSSFTDYIQARHAQRRQRQGSTRNGLYCPACRHTHPYKGSIHKESNNLQLGIRFDKRGEAHVTVWLCPLTGDVLGEIWPGSKSETVRPEPDQLTEATD